METKMYNNYESLKLLLESDTSSIFNIFEDVCVNNGIDFIYKKQFPRYLYIKGNRPDKILLVAHTDTVWGNVPIKVKINNGIIYNENIETIYPTMTKNQYEQSAVGIGADDRVGCFFLLEFLQGWIETKSPRHSILLNEFEEITLGHTINGRDPYIHSEVIQHRFAMEFDRGGDRLGYCFYNNEPESFKNYIARSFPAYVCGTGTGSDIKEFCKNRIPSVNINCGYYKAHSPYEFIDFDNMCEIFYDVKTFLSKEQYSWIL